MSQNEPTHTTRKPGLLNKQTAEGRLYSGPLKFRGRCEHCNEPRNRHCGRCRACPGFHMGECVKWAGTGSWH